MASATNFLRLRAVNGVDYSLLRSWLGLPPGPWPPDHYTLLGLPLGRCEPAVVEPRVLERMDLLRRRQLLHPELVTEGMNRLAQALITLTDPVGKTAYDTQLGIPLPDAPTQQRPPAPSSRPAPADPGRESTLVVAGTVFDDDIFTDDAQAADFAGEPPDSGDATRVIQQPAEFRDYHPGAVEHGEIVRGEPAGPLPTQGPPELLPYEVVSDKELPYEVIPTEELAPPLIEYDQRGATEPLEDVVEAVALGPSVTVTAVDGPAGRRWIYGRLALLRKMTRAWEQLRPILADPQDPIDRPGRVLILLEAVWAVRPLLPALRGVIGAVGGPGGLVGAVVRQPLVLDTIRRLLPHQRQAVAIDWKRGQVELQKEYARLRRLARRRDRRSRSRGKLSISRWIKETPEIALVLLALVAMAIAWLRSAAGP